MTDHNSPDELCSLWQDQPVAPFQMSTDELRVMMQQNYRRYRIWYGSVYYYVGFGAIIFMGCVVMLNRNFTTIQGLCLLFFILVYTSLREQRYAQERKASFDKAEASGNTGSLAFYQSVLERQLKYDRSLHWIRFIVCPIFVFMQIGIMFRSPNYPHTVPNGISMFALVVAYPLAMILGWLYTLKEERKCQSKIEALDALLRAPE